jgi:hypothetical protein
MMRGVSRGCGTLGGGRRRKERVSRLRTRRRHLGRREEAEIL